MRRDCFRLFQSHILCYIPLLNGNIHLRALFLEIKNFAQLQIL